MNQEENGGIMPNKNISQKDWQFKLSSKIKEIESLIKNYDLEEKQKTLEIQKNNAYFKLEKIGKELENIENFLEEENDNKGIEELENEENLKKKIYDIKQKNITIQSQLNIIKGYSEFVKKYKASQIKEKKKLDIECDNIKNDIKINKSYSKMTEDEKILLEKRKELENIDKELGKLLKKIEDQKAQNYIKNVRLKQLKYLINNQKDSKKNLNSKKINKAEPKKKIIKKNNNNKNEEVDEIFDNIIQNSNQENNQKSNKGTKNESTFDIINRRIPFSISSLDNLINENNENLLISEKSINQKNYSSKKNVNISKKKKTTSDLIKLEKENISKMVSSSENKNDLNNKNNNIQIDKNNNNKNDTKKNNDNIILIDKKENTNKNEFNEENPLGWLENDNNKNSKFNNINNMNNNIIINNNFNNNKEETKIDNNESNIKEQNINNNIFNNKNSNISEVKGLLGRRRPFASIKF